MRLLIVTQKVNRNDPVLGFFHRWINEFAGHFESIIVICLEEGAHELPANVRVLSLGKEKKKSRLQYIARFYRYIWKERKNYDAVLVHMNQEYVVLGGVPWKLAGKKIFMWRNHYKGSSMTDLAAFFCTKVFCTSKFSYTAKYPKTVFMPVGVDTDFFRANRGVVRIPRSILSFGRISSSKRLDLLVEALGVLKGEGVQFTASIYGDALPADIHYRDSLLKKTTELGMNDRVTFYPGVPNDQAPAIYSRHELFINLSPNGMYDKTMFEAAACGCVVIASNKDLLNVFGPEYVLQSDDTAEIASKLRSFLNRKDATDLRRVIEEKHSLKLLGKRLAEEVNG